VTNENITYFYKCEFNNEYQGLYGGLPKIVYPVREAIVKLVKIKEERKKIFPIPIENVQQQREREIFQRRNTTIGNNNLFNQSVQIQNEIFMKSLSDDLEPICPNILYSEIMIQSNFKDIFSRINEPLTLLFLETILKGENEENANNVKIGVVIMEMIPNSYPLTKYFPGKVERKIGKAKLVNY
jgi:hypothetical protein